MGDGVPARPCAAEPGSSPRRRRRGVTPRPAAVATLALLALLALLAATASAAPPDAGAWQPDGGGGGAAAAVSPPVVGGGPGRWLLAAKGKPGPPIPTPWGPVAAVILCLLPIAFLLIVTMVKKVLLPTSISLPAAAVMLALIRLAYLSSPPALVAACCVSGLLEALTPLSIITGAIMLFQAMHHTKCLPWMMGQIKSLSAGHPVAEIFLIGFSFAYLVEGASGFGTPVALAAPMLSSLGHDPLMTVVCLLIMNTLATQFGAVGTPVWFGFGDLGLGEANLQLVGFKAALLVGVCAYVIAPLAASFLVPMRELLRSSLFVVLSITTAVGPSVLISLFSYEFPSLIGGLASVLLTGLLVRFKVGLRPYTSGRAAEPPSPSGSSSCSAVAAPSTVGRRRSALAQSSAARSRRSSRSVCSPSFSFVESVGVVGHPPVATLDFPLTNAPAKYPGRHNFGAQADEAAIGEELAAAAAAAAAAGLGGGGGGEAAAAAADVEAGHPDAAPSPRANGAAAAAKPLFKQQPQQQPQHKQQPPRPPLRRSPSGHMELDPLDPEVAVRPRFSAKDLVLRTLPIWLTVLVLLLTRIPALPIKKVLQSQTPAFVWRLGTLGDFGASASLVVFLRRILGEPLVSWRYEVLYVPFVLPFLAASLATVAVHRRDLEVPWATPFREAFQRVAGITVATLGALALVQLIRVGEAGSPAFIIGFYLSRWLAQGFLAISAFLGALGSFFSGSTTVSNLTFGDIQKIAAEEIGAPVTSMLAVQVAGATIGNMICINNILSAKAVMNMTHVGEGEFIRRTAPVALLFLLMAEALGLVFTLGGALPDRPMASEY